MVIIMAILSISTQGEVTHERRAEFSASGAVPRLADEPAALVIIIRVSRSHLERFGEVEFLNEFVLTSQKHKAAFRTEFEKRVLLFLLVVVGVMAPFPQPHSWHAISKEITTPLRAFEPDFCQTRSKRQGGRIRGSRLRSFHLLPSCARLWLHGSLREFRMQS